MEEQRRAPKRVSIIDYDSADLYYPIPAAKHQCTPAKSEDATTEVLIFKIIYS